MDEANPIVPTETSSDIDVAKEFYNMILTSHKLISLVNASKPLAERSISLSGFSLLVAVVGNPDKAAFHVFQRASLPRKGQQIAARNELINAGFVEMDVVEGDRRTLRVTEEGNRALETIKKELGDLAASANIHSWKAVPRLASIVRDLRPALWTKFETKGEAGAADTEKTAA